MRKTIIVMAVLLFVSSMTFGQFMDGNELYKYLLSYDTLEGVDREINSTDFIIDVTMAVGYVKGIYDSVKTTTEIMVHYDFPPNITLSQIMDVVVKYFKEHPEIRHQTASVLVSKALLEAWPRRKEPNKKGGEAKIELNDVIGIQSQ